MIENRTLGNIVIAGLVWALSILLVISCSKELEQVPPVNPYVSERDSDFLPDYSVKKADLINDIDKYIDRIDEVHPDPYRLISREDFVTEVEKVKYRIDSLDNENVGIFDCYYYLQGLAALLLDGHTKIHRPRDWEKTVTSFFPLNVRIIENRVFVDRNFGDNEIPLKAELVDIDGVDVNEILADMLGYCEGTFYNYKMIRVEENFRYFLHTYYRFRAPWTIGYIVDGLKKTAPIDGIGLDLLNERNKRNVMYSFANTEVGKQQVPVLRLPHLGYGKEKFQRDIDQFFDDHRNQEYIILDLRGCPGGNGLRTFDVADHLIDSVYSGSRKFSFRVSQPLKDYVKYYTQSKLYKQNKPIGKWRELLYSEGVYGDKNDDQYRNILDSDLNAFYVTHTTIDHSPDSRLSKYEGRVFLLIDQRSFSAAVVFASIFKHYKLATIVGRETGGRVDFFSDAIDIELPKSRLIAKIPTALLTLHGDTPHRGVFPDMTVDLTVHDYLRAIDPDIEAIKGLIE
ncbi:S41 family peptidase [Candidatus Zixiibacteriota bacterium]